MQLIEPLLEIIPFEDKLALKSSISIPKQAQKQYINRSFLMFVIQIRSSMSEQDIYFLKNCILDMCQQLLERNGIDNIGFVINQQYFTIRTPNYEGIKDLLNRLKVSDNVDFNKTLQCLRNSITAQFKKLEQAKLTLFVFSSNVAQDEDRKIKATYRQKLNSHLPNYYDMIKKIKRAIREYCLDSQSYVIGYVKKYNNDKTEQFDYLTNLSDSLDCSLLYELMETTARQGTFEVSNSKLAFKEKMEAIVSLILYQFHKLYVMVPVRSDYKSEIMQEDQRVENVKEMCIEEGMVKKEEDYERREMEQKSLQGRDSERDSEQDSNGQESEFMAQNNTQTVTKYIRIELFNVDESRFVTSTYKFIDRREIDLESLHDNGYYLSKTMSLLQTQNPTNNPHKFPISKKVMKKLAYLFKPSQQSRSVQYHNNPNIVDSIECKVQYYQLQLNRIIKIMMKDIIKYKRRYIGDKKYQYYMEIDEQLQFKLRERVQRIETIAREIYAQVFNPQIITTQKDKRRVFELYSALKVKIDAANEALMNLFKKQINNSDIGNLSRALNFEKIRSSMRRKLIKRMNSNPTLIDDTYNRIQQICDNKDYVEIEAMNKIKKSAFGNCMYSFDNFVGALRKRDCLALIFEMERPDTAIADPGRIRIRQVSTMVTTVSKFFQIHQYGITQSWAEVAGKYQQKIVMETAKEHQLKREYTLCKVCLCCCNFNQSSVKQQKAGQFFSHQEMQERTEVPENKVTGCPKCGYSIDGLWDGRCPICQNIVKQEIPQNPHLFGINKSDYKQRWDYWNRVQRTQSSYGIMPLYICDENWEVSKLLMKLCLAWTACRQPMGYCYAQYETIPFMVLSSLIRQTQQCKYRVEQLRKQAQNYTSYQQLYHYNSLINLEHHKQLRYQQLLQLVQQTCNVMMKQMSAKPDQKLIDKTIEKYKNYKYPINRTIDVISNNSCYLGQLYTVLKMRPIVLQVSQQAFHEFFKRLVEQQLRRETDGWNEEEVQDKMENRLLNAKVEQMNKPEYIVMNSIYRDRFEQALKGIQVYRTEFQIQRLHLEMMLKQNNTFNDTQRLALIEYKRLYENRVLWMWYVRFRLYKEFERIQIHKWKCLDLTNSYTIFTMIIQNKKQRKNHKRRQAILAKDYVDPFDYYSARPYLQMQYMRLRNKKQSKNIVLLNNEKYGKAAIAFAQSKDLDEAAGALLNTNLNQQIIFYYEQLFHDPKLVQEKLRMLLNGQHKNVRLMKNGWIMSRKRMNNLRERYPFEFQKYQYMF